MTVWAKARLVDLGVLAKDLTDVTNFVNQHEFSGDDRRWVNSRRETIVGVLTGRFHAAVTTDRRFELEKRRGLVRLEILPGTPSTFAARQGLETRLITAFRTALLSIPAEPTLTTTGPLEALDWEGPFQGAVAIDDSYFDAFRHPVRKAARFDAG